MNNVGSDDEELDQVLAGCRGRYHLRDRALVVLGTHTGFRIGELLSLAIADVWDGRDVTRTVTVKAQYVKGGKVKRTMPLHERARTAIREWVLALHTKGITSPAQALFPRQLRNHAMTRHQARRIILLAASNAGIPLERLGTHTLRRHLQEGFGIHLMSARILPR
jgi:site-specific recombinase XerD